MGLDLLLLLLLVLLLLPLHLLSLASRLFLKNPNINNHNITGSKRRRWVLSLVTIPLLLSTTILALSDLDSSPSKDAALISETENLKLKIARLESILQENTDVLDSKNRHLEESNKLVEGMEHKIRFLESSLSKLKTSTDSSSYSETMITMLEEQVRLLWAESRKNNFDCHILESKAHEEEKKAKEVASQVVKMENIVAEQWIQIRQLEQSLQMMKIMASNARKKSASKMHKKKRTEFTVLKFIRSVGHHYLPDGTDLPDTFFLGNYISKSCISQSLGRLRRVWSAAKKWHHELQDSVKWVLELHEFTAPVAHKEVVFFMASAVVVIPIMSAWILFS